MPGHTGGQGAEDAVGGRAEVPVQAELDPDGHEGQADHVRRRAKGDPDHRGVREEPRPQEVKPLALGQGGTSLHGQRTSRLGEVLAEADVAGRRGAVSLVAAGASINDSFAPGAFRGLRRNGAHWPGSAAPTASFCRRSPTSLPSEVVIGELSSLCSTIE